MTAPKTVLIACTHPSQPTGYARVGAALANGFAARGMAVTVFGYQNVIPRTVSMHQAVTILDVAKEVQNPFAFGESLLAAHLARTSYDKVILYNDVLVLRSFLDALANIRIPRLIIYLDLVHDDQLGVQDIVRRADEIWVFSDYWKGALESTSEIDVPVHVVPHGVDSCFRPLDPQACRKALGLPAQGLIVLNTNRNSYRKALDVTIRVFLEVYKRHHCPKDFFLFLNCNTSSCDTGYDIPFLIRAECQRLGLDWQDVAQHRILGMPNAGFLSDETLCQLYNACDVGINTCTGEGFGLPTLEHGSLGKPQLATATGGLRDLLKNEAIPPIERLALCKGFVPHSGTMHVPDSQAFVEKLSSLYTLYSATSTSASSYTLPCDLAAYAWPAIIDSIIDTWSTQKE